MTNDGTPLVTIFIPSYNHESFVTYCIESVIEQTYQNVELIIIDDGSSDGSVEIIGGFQQRCQDRFHRFVYIHRENKGLSATCNQALTLAAGEYFSLIASDDILLPDKLSKQVSYLEENSNAAAVFGLCKVIDNDNNVIGESSFGKEKYSFEDIILLKHNLKAPTAMVRKHLIQEVGGYDERVIIEDWYMWLKLSENNKYFLGLLPDVVTMYRRHGSNISSQNKLMLESALIILNQYKHLEIYDQAYTNLISAIVYDASFSEYIFPLKLLLQNKNQAKRERFNQLIRVLTPISLLKLLRKIKHGR